jgi:hypothetical protein
VAVGADRRGYWRFLADHEVRLDPDDWQFGAFGDLTGYLSWHVAPDRRREEEARIVGEVDAWIGSLVLGPIADTLERRRPVAVRVVVPAAAEALLFRPLELAHAGGEPLSAQEITLVMQAGREDGDVLTGSERLRVLGPEPAPRAVLTRAALRRDRHHGEGSGRAGAAVRGDPRAAAGRSGRS